MIVVIVGGLTLRAAVPLGQAGAGGHGRQGGLAGGGPGPARDDRPALHPGRPAQAEDRRGRHRRCRTPSRWAARPEAATVCATTGIMKTLSPAELEGVMAHELAHVKNRDVLIMTIASFFASVASMILQFAFFFGGGDDDEGAPPVLRGASIASFARLHHLLLPDARPLALPRVRGRPRRRARSPAARARSPRRCMRISERMEPVPNAGPARGRADERLLHRADRA